MGQAAIDMKYFKQIFLIVFLFSNVPYLVQSATYERLNVQGYVGNPYTGVKISLINLKVTPDTTPRSVSFELHSRIDYKYKIYIQVNSRTFGFGKIPINLSYKKGGEFYIHAHGGDPVSLRRIDRALEDDDRLLFRGICNFVKDRENITLIFEKVIAQSSGDAREYWERYRKSMERDIRDVGRKCANKLGGEKITFKDKKSSIMNPGTYAQTCGLGVVTIKEAQMHLKSLGLYTSAIDGIVGNGTISAIGQGKELLGGDVEKCLTVYEINSLKHLAYSYKKN